MTRNGASGEPLEEVVLASKHSVEALLAPGTVVAVDGDRLLIERPYLGGWYVATRGDSYVLARSGEPSPLWDDVASTPLLPTPQRFAEGVQVVEFSCGASAERPISREAWTAFGLALLEFLVGLEERGLTIVDAVPASVAWCDASLRLVLPPALCRVGGRASPVFREGITPPELVGAGEPSTRSGVYVAFALLYELATGATLPTTGWSALEASRLRTPGLPQLFARALRHDPAERPGAAVLLDGLLAAFAPPPHDVVAGGFTSIGMNEEREQNEDSYALSVQTLRSGLESRQVVQACVADGIGGAMAGEWASRAAAAAFCAPVTEAPREVSAQQRLAHELAWRANRAVLDTLAGADGGCTLTGVLIVNGRTCLAHVGDSRLYRFRDGRLEQLTRDHVFRSPDGECATIDGSLLRSIGAIRHEQPGYVDVEIVGQGAAIELGADEGLLLVTDGVWGVLSDETMAGLVAGAAGPSAKARALVQAALEAGSMDNATALVVERME